MQEMERLQAKGEVTEEVLHAMEEDMTGKVQATSYFMYSHNNLALHLQILLASWRGTRFEVVQVLREVNHFSTRESFGGLIDFHQVVDNVLKDREVSDQVLINRAKVCLQGNGGGVAYNATKGSVNYWPHLQDYSAGRV